MIALEMLSGLYLVLLFCTCIAEEHAAILLHVGKAVMLHASANLVLLELCKPYCLLSEVFTYTTWIPREIAVDPSKQR